MVGSLLSGLWQGASSLYSSSKQEQAAAKIAQAEEQAQAVEKRYSDWAENNTGTAAANGAYNMAKAKTGTLAAQTSQSQAYASQNAQQNAGINKAQAAMSSQNLNNYSDIYNDQFEINREAATEALDQANESMRIGSEQEAANIRNAAKAEAENMLSGDLATDIGKQLSSDFSDIWSSVTSSDFWFGETSEKTKQAQLEAGASGFMNWAKQNSRKNQGYASLWSILNSGKAYSDLSTAQKQTLANMVDTYGKTNGNRNAASNLQSWYGSISSWLSDERCKSFEPASLVDCINSLYDTLSNMQNYDEYTQQEYDTLKLAYDFIDLLVRLKHGK